jgi:hypothetical protein
MYLAKVFVNFRLQLYILFSGNTCKSRGSICMDDDDVCLYALCLCETFVWVSVLNDNTSNEYGCVWSLVYSPSVKVVCMFMWDSCVRVCVECFKWMMCVGVCCAHCLSSVLLPTLVSQQGVLLHAAADRGVLLPGCSCFCHRTPYLDPPGSQTSGTFFYFLWIKCLFFK